MWRQLKHSGFNHLLNSSQKKRKLILNHGLESSTSSKKSCHKISIIKVSETFHTSTPLLTADFLVIRILCSPSSENHSNKWQNIPSKHLTIAFFHRAAAFPERSANGMGTAQRNDTLIIETHPDGLNLGLFCGKDSGWLLWIPAVWNFFLVNLFFVQNKWWLWTCSMFFLKHDSDPLHFSVARQSWEETTATQEVPTQNTAKQTYEHLWHFQKIHGLNQPPNQRFYPPETLL